MYRSAQLTLREMIDMRDAHRDSVKFIEGSYRELLEQRHVAVSDDNDIQDNGDRLLGSRYI
jgi:hypothetical protein